jgi:nitroreductase
MSLVYALHFKGIGACMLNWSASKENDMELRKLIDVPDKEKITIIIACGYLPDTFKIARSPRMKTEEITLVR